MGALDDMLAADSAVFTDPDGFGEAITYTPKGGAPITVNAVVFRDPPLEIPNAPRQTAARHLQVFVRNHATLGVTSVDVQGDTVHVADRYGGSTTPHAIVAILTQDAAGWLLKLR